MQPLKFIALLVATAAWVLPWAPVVLAQSDTTGQKLEHAPGYTFGSNVAGYLQLSTDICDIKTAIGDGPNPPYADALKIYESGKNSRKSDGSIRTLKELATKPYTGEETWELFKDYYKTPAFMNQPVMAAFNGTSPYRRVGQRNETISKGLEVLLQTVYLLHEIDETTALIRANRLAATDGAPHNIDEIWAIYTGIKPACSLWGSANRRGAEFGTMQDCSTSRVNAAMTALHRQMYDAATKGDVDTFLELRQEVIRLFVITYIQATLKYAQLMDKAYAKGEMDTVYTEQAEGAMFFRTIEPFIAEVNNSSAATVRSVLSVGAAPKPNSLAIVQTALEPTYAPLNITQADIGSYGAQQPGLNCPAPATGARSAAAAPPAVAARGSLLIVLLTVLLLLTWVA